MSTMKDMLGRTSLISVHRAKEILFENISGTIGRVEELPIADSLGRVLASPILSTEHIPPHPRSVMDGFAVQAADTYGASESMPCYLEITGSVAMGEVPTDVVAKGCCFRIATGGFLPDGADCVIMHEHTVPVDETMVEIIKGSGTGTNVIQTGDDIQRGQEPLPVGHVIRPQDIGLFAALGKTNVTVQSKVKVGIIATGDEIVAHDKTLRPGKIRDINSPALAAMVHHAGGIAVHYGIVSDQKEIFFPVLEKAVQENDIVLFSGGSSVGVRDLGEEAVEAMGPPGLLVHGVKLKPGKPILIGKSGEKLIFGLPGHPVSALVCFELFVRDVIKTLSGAAHTPSSLRPNVRAVLGRNINSAAGRLDIVRVRLNEDNGQVIADPVLGKSGAISTLARADGYFVIDEESQGVTQGSTVEVVIFQ